MAPFGDTHHFTNSALARRGFALIEGSRPAQASDHAIAELANRIPRTSRAKTHRLPRHLAGSFVTSPEAPRLSYLFHADCPRLRLFRLWWSNNRTGLFSEQSESFRQSEKSSGSQKADVNG